MNLLWWRWSFPDFQVALLLLSLGKQLPLDASLGWALTLYTLGQYQWGYGILVGLLIRMEWMPVEIRNYINTQMVWNGWSLSTCALTLSYACMEPRIFFSRSVWVFVTLLSCASYVNTTQHNNLQKFVLALALKAAVWTFWTLLNPSTMRANFFGVCPILFFK
uniref:Uncharacterized protein n=1 Tax=viral metagenome TaxID=1070528 RepID=A0A6C0BNG0_9ZZZZ